MATLYQICCAEINCDEKFAKEFSRPREVPAAEAVEESNLEAADAVGAAATEVAFIGSSKSGTVTLSPSGDTRKSHEKSRKSNMVRKRSTKGKERHAEYPENATWFEAVTICEEKAERMRW